METLSRVPDHVPNLGRVYFNNSLFSSYLLQGMDLNRMMLSNHRLSVAEWL